MKKNKNFLIKNLIDSMDASSKGTILRSMAIFTAIELCGSILNGKTKGNSKKNFISFCNSTYMKTPKYSKVSTLLYSIFRCGVSHSYISKGAALLSSNYKDKKKHLSFYKNGLFIYVPEFSDDVKTAVKLFYKDIIKKQNLNTNYVQVIKQLDNDGTQEYQNFIQSNNIVPINLNIGRDIFTDLP